MAGGKRFVVIGGGIVGLAVAEQISATRPGASVTVLEKEDRWATHQTGRNSGVVHSGLYYRPGSRKAMMCRRGAESIIRFAQHEGVAVERCGKLVVASSAQEVAQLRSLADRGRQNGLIVNELDPVGAREFEPNVSCVAALHVPATAITDYVGISEALARRLDERGADLRRSSEVMALRHGLDRTTVETTTGEVAADIVINCAGLHSDRVARMGGGRPAARIVPFRGEYYELRGDRRHLVRSLIYPVPDPRFPFLGVHLTRTVDGGVHAGPNAVLALAREGYDWRTVRLPDLAATLRFPGFWRLAAHYARTGAQEMRRSLSRHQFATSIRRLVPAIQDDDLVSSAAGVRAQAVRADGSLVDDFVIEQEGRLVNVINAPSPAATCALEIAHHIEALLAD